MVPNDCEEFLGNESDTVVNFENKNNDGLHSSWILYLSAFSVDLLLMPTGSMLVWPSSAIPKLMSNNTDINPLGRSITNLEISLMVSVIPFAVIIGLLFTSKVADGIGRKRTLFFYGIILFCCITTIAFANNIYIYYGCFFIFGLLLAGILTTAAVYNTEIAEDKNRTWLSCCVNLAQPFGEFLGYSLGATIDSIKTSTLLINIPILLHIILHWFIVESPVYLINHKKRSLALSTLHKLRTYDKFEDVRKEYRSLEQYSCNIENKVKLFDLFKSHETKKAFILSGLLFFTQQMCGKNELFPFMGLMFKEAGTILPGNFVGMVVGFIDVTMVLLLIFIINRFGRRRLLLISTSLASISLMGVAFYFFIKDIESPFNDHIRWLPVSSIIIYVISYGLGLGGIPTGYVAELFPNELRATAVSTIFILATFITLGLTFGFPLLSAAFGISFCLFLYSISTFIGFILLYFSLPETRGKSFREIQEMLQGNIFNCS